MWRVVWGERGRGTESSLGWNVGDIEVAAATVGSDGDCARDESMEDSSMMRGVSRAVQHAVRLLLVCMD